MKCPHCNVEVHPQFSEDWVARGGEVGRENDEPTSWLFGYMACPSCARAIIFLSKRVSGQLRQVTMVYPQRTMRPNAAVEVPEHLAVDYNEACTVLELSPKSAAALGRRCLQHLLRDQGYAQKDLAKAIEAVIASKSLPTALGNNVDAIRVIGNFAAHPIKDSNSGAIVEVEPEEAAWNLDVLEGLFDYYYVQPARSLAKSAALNAKLAAAGKPAMKT